MHRVGQLRKQKPGMMGGWQERLVEVDNKKLSYFKKNKDLELVRGGVLSFDFYQISVRKFAKEPIFALCLKGNDREFVF